MTAHVYLMETLRILLECAQSGYGLRLPQGDFMSKRHISSTAALTLALSLGTFAMAIAPRAYAAPLQEHHDEMRTDHDAHPEYYNNRYYRLGNREGWEDHRRNVQRKEHNHHFKTDEDRQAHDYGYHEGWSGTRWQDRH